MWGSLSQIKRIIKLRNILEQFHFFVVYVRILTQSDVSIYESL